MGRGLDGLHVAPAVQQIVAVFHAEALLKLHGVLLALVVFLAPVLPDGVERGVELGVGGVQGRLGLLHGLLDHEQLGVFGQGHGDGLIHRGGNFS
jgi:hypothetical protein